MSRWWTQRVAAIGDVLGLGLATLLLLLAAALVAAAWYWYPAWLPWRLPRSRRSRRAPRREVAASTDESAGGTTDELPDLPTEAFVSLADRYAAQGLYAQAVRERLRAIVRELVDAGVIDNRPGWTITELARIAGTARPAVAAPLDAASLLFSEIWYGQRPAYAAHDERMRGYAAQVHAALGPAPARSAA